MEYSDDPTILSRNDQRIPVTREMLRIGWRCDAVNSEMTVGSDGGEVRSGARSRILIWILQWSLKKRECCEEPT
jgi:hypothetical protein